MERISKPHIVDFLRLCDRKHWLHPRVRYASIRSKPQLLCDLCKHFRTRRAKQSLLFLPLRPLPGVPRIEYSFPKKAFLLDNQPIDVPKRSKEALRFRYSPGPVTVTFPQIRGSPPEQAADFAIRRDAGLYGKFRKPGIGSPRGFSGPNRLSHYSVRTPNLEPFGPPALGTRTPGESQGTSDFSYL